MSDLRDRNLLYARLEEVLGSEPAGILMQQLPPEGGIATKSDVAGLGVQIGNLAGRVDGLENRMDGLDQRMDGLDQRMDGLDQRMDGLDQRMDGLDQRMDGLDQRMDRMERHMERFDDRLHDLHGALREQTRHYILANTGLMVALTGIAFGAASLT